ncbi:hypothetical protein [Mechercharimyces sp. CAU 1602]|uniref:hypothetical protein n=1 Tax=Mechercharimyces sp. CAU 1602 TaxID=2973933 RepID=UPI002163F100|nr:hypothetical protein [Mechercharimyces sp. CAU 1602]MCS1351884.1 hypothetical protein [Mechercharimyces sp. CAU 1602]
MDEKTITGVIDYSWLFRIWKFALPLAERFFIMDAQSTISSKLRRTNNKFNYFITR